jgi:hypothetical protein
VSAPVFDGAVAPYFDDGQATLYLGDALDVARELPDGAADCIVTSPPYFGMRDYCIEGQYGLELTPAEYVGTMRALFVELPLNATLCCRGRPWRPGHCRHLPLRRR